MIEYPLKRYRIERGWTQERMGAEIGYPKATVSRWENRKRTPRPKNAKDIEKKIGIPAADLLLFEPEGA